MIDKLRSMAVFARVAEAGSFRRAAERLGLSASVVSHHITHLENQLGAQLLYRSTRHVSLTDQGECFYQSCRTMLAAAETALDSLQHGQQNMVGKLWVLAPAPFSSGPFIADVAEFCERHPGVTLRLDFDDGPHNLVQEGIDVAIRFGAQENSTLVTRTLFELRPQLYAAPSYLEKVGRIEDLEALQSAQWICQDATLDIVLTGPDGVEVRLVPQARITVNNAVAQHELALAGIGVAQLPSIMVDPDVQAGRLVELVPDWQFAKLSCCAIYPTRAAPQALSRCFVDFIYEKMQAVTAQLNTSK